MMRDGYSERICFALREHVLALRTSGIVLEIAI